MVFRNARVAVFIDGCFWHSCPTHGTKPKTNREYWLPKLRANKRRDKAFDDALKEAGWLVIRAWEHDDPQVVAGKVIKLVKRRVSSTA